MPGRHYNAAMKGRKTNGRISLGGKEHELSAENHNPFLKIICGGDSLFIIVPNSVVAVFTTPFFFFYY